MPRVKFHCSQVLFDQLKRYSKNTDVSLSDAAKTLVEESLSKKHLSDDVDERDTLEFARAQLQRENMRRDRSPWQRIKTSISAAFGVASQ